MKTVSVMLWELDERDIARLPCGFPVLRYDTLCGNLRVLRAGDDAFSREKRYVYLLYKLPSAIPENGDERRRAASDQIAGYPRKRGKRPVFERGGVPAGREAGE